MYKRIIKRLARAFGYEVRRVQTNALPNSSDIDAYSKLSSLSPRPVDIELFSDIASTIPGMISVQSGKILYALSYFQVENGDVVEVGCWQGRSSSFLAKATSESKNGAFYAIDHFKGNEGKEHYYVVNERDLSDLKSGFIKNMSRIRLRDSIKLLDMSTDYAVEELRNNGVEIRFLFIDGDHSEDGVRRDMRLLFPLLVDGALVAFDDYSTEFPDLVKAVDAFLQSGSFSRFMTYKNTLVVRYRKR